MPVRDRPRYQSQEESNVKRRRATTVLLVGLILVLGVPGVSATPPPGNPSETRATTTDIQILSLNDFHGQLQTVNPVSSSGGRIGALQGTSPNQTCLPPTCVPAGGVEYLATHVRSLRAENPNTVFVSAGDLIGATPLLSALFHDEPTIEAFNLMGLEFNGVGNHEFDEGVGELLRMQNGGCHPVDGCGDGDGFDGAAFDFLAANVTYKSNGETIFPPYAIREFKGVNVAFVGMTLKGTPLIVSPGGIATVDFLDEAASVNALVPELKAQGIETIVVLLHEGGIVGPGAGGPGTGGNPALINTCDNPRGPLPPIVEAMDDEIDIVITGHTNWAINCLIDGKVVTGAASQGRLITDIDFSVSRATKDVVGPISVNNRIVTQDVPKAADLTALIAEYNVFAGPIAAVVVGETTAAMDRSILTPGRESTIGRLIADAQLESSAGAGAVIAFMNPGGIRANLDAGPITHGEAFAVQPFSNIVTTKTMTGAQIEMVLEQQFTVSATGSLRTTPAVLLVSSGFTYTWDGAGPAGNRIDPSLIKLNGVTLDPAGTYRVTMNNFLAAGGDDFPAFTLGTAEQTGLDDLVALEAYLGAHNPYTPVTDVRITRVN
jgi:5'-nucleotidase